MTTPFEQSIIDAFEPVYQRICKDTEGMIDELPPNSSIGSHGNDYIVRTPIGIAIAATVAEAYKAAMEMVSAKEARDDR